MVTDIVRILSTVNTEIFKILRWWSATILKPLNAICLQPFDGFKRNFENSYFSFYVIKLQKLLKQN